MLLSVAQGFAPWKRWSTKTVLTAIQVLAGCALFFEGCNQAVMGGLNSTPGYVTTVKIGTADGTITRTTKQGGIVSVYYFGALFGALFAGWLADKVGRRLGLFFGTLWCILGAALMASAQNANWMICARVIAGFGTGHLNTVTPALVMETSETRVRGRTFSLTFLANYIGIVVMYWLQFGLRYVDGPFRWRFPPAFMIISPLILAVAIWFVPESPRFLISEGRISEAREVIAKLQGLSLSPNSSSSPDSHAHPSASASASALEEDDVVEREILAIQASVSEKSETKGPLLFKMLTGVGTGDLHLGRRTCLALGIMIMMEWTGVLAITTYANTLFSVAGYSSTKGAWLSGLANTVGIAGTLTAAFTIDTFGRRQLCFLGGILQCISMFLTGGLAAGAKSHPDQAASYGAGSATFIFVFSYVFAATWLQVAFTYPAEIWPTELRARGNAFGVVGWAIGCGWTTLLIPVMFGNLDEKALYIFGAINAAIVPTVWLFFPETAGKSLESINNLFASRSPLAHAEEKEYARLEALQAGTALAGHPASGMRNESYPEKREKGDLV